MKDTADKSPTGPPSESELERKAWEVLLNFGFPCTPARAFEFASEFIAERDRRRSASLLPPKGSPDE